jgi:hypothetical protein
MSIRDLFFLVHCVGMQRTQRGRLAGAIWQSEVYPKKGYGAASVRLEKAGFITHDPTATRKPYGYIPTDKGYKLVNSAIRLMELAT